MPVAYLTASGMRASLEGERLEVEYLPEGHLPGSALEKRWIPLVDIEHVVVDAEVRLSTHSLCGLLTRGIPLLLLSHGTLPAGLAQPFARSTEVLARQLDRCRTADFRLAQAKALVAAKIANQRRVLQRLAANRGEPGNHPAAAYLAALLNQVAATASLDALRGLEGAAAGRYFERLADFFPRDLPFERRSRRPPHNEANALLSFLYTLLTAELALHCRATGLEAAWGVFHEAEDGRPSLALDLLEPFRAPLADALALDLLNHRRLTAADFEFPAEGGCLLRRDARKRLFVALEERLQREFQSEQYGHRTTLRQCMKDLVLDFKKALGTAHPVSPFLMN